MHKQNLSDGNAISLALLLFRSLPRSYMYIYICKQRLSSAPLVSEVATVHYTKGDDDVNNDERFLKINFHIRIIDRNISAHRARRGKIKILLLYNSNPSYRLRLFRTSSVQPLSRFGNHGCF